MKYDITGLYDCGPNKIRTFSGVYVDVIDPDPDTILIEDIAHALSHQPRFAGHLPETYSVAQHSIWCCRNVLVRSERLAALLHDASEPYLVDVPTPVKANLQNYKEIEHNLMIVIAKKFGFDWPKSRAVEDVDKEAIAYEWHNMALGKGKVICLSADEAKKEFLYMFGFLKNNRPKIHVFDMPIAKGLAV